jgi:hypothetical protein
MDYTNPYNSPYQDQTQQNQNFGQTSFSQYRNTTDNSLFNGGAMGLNYNRNRQQNSLFPQGQQKSFGEDFTWRFNNPPGVNNVASTKPAHAINPTTGMDSKEMMDYAMGQLSNRSWMNLERKGRRGNAARGELSAILGAANKAFGSQQDALSEYSAADQRNRGNFGIWKNSFQEGLQKLAQQGDARRKRFNLGMEWLGEKSRHNRQVEQLAWELVKNGKLPANWQKVLDPSGSYSSSPWIQRTGTQRLLYQNVYGTPQRQRQDNKDDFWKRWTNGEIDFHETPQAWQERQQKAQGQEDQLAKSRDAAQRLLNGGPLF